MKIGILPSGRIFFQLCQTRCLLEVFSYLKQPKRHLLWVVFSGWQISGCTAGTAGWVAIPPVRTGFGRKLPRWRFYRRWIPSVAWLVIGRVPKHWTDAQHWSYSIRLIQDQGVFPGCSFLVRMPVPYFLPCCGVVSRCYMTTVFLPGPSVPGLRMVQAMVEGSGCLSDDASLWIWTSLRLSLRSALETRCDTLSKRTWIAWPPSATQGHHHSGRRCPPCPGWLEWSYRCLPPWIWCLWCLFQHLQLRVCGLPGSTGLWSRWWQCASEPSLEEAWDASDLIGFA